MRVESNSLAALSSKAKVKVYLNTSEILEHLKISEIFHNFDNLSKQSLSIVIVIRNDISVSLGMRSSPTDDGHVC